MKIILNGLVLVAIEGPASQLATLSKEGLTAGGPFAYYRPWLGQHTIIRRRPARPAKPRKFVPWVWPGRLELPPIPNAECWAWKTADARYTFLRTQRPGVLAHWRGPRFKPNRTPYDNYMLQAVPHLLRGLPAYDYPLETTHYTLKALWNPTRNERTTYGSDNFADPPPECQTYGAHFAVAGRAIATSVPPFPPDTKHLWIYQLHAYDLQRPLAALFYHRHALCQDRTTPPPADWSPWYASTLSTQWSLWSDNPIPYLALQHALPEVDDDGNTIAPGQADPAQTTPVCWFDGQAILKHWPRLLASHRTQAPPPPYVWPPWDEPISGWHLEPY